MTTQFIELETINEDDLKTVQGGGVWKEVVNIGVGLIPGVGLANKCLGLAGGPTIGDLVE